VLRHDRNRGLGVVQECVGHPAELEPEVVLLSPRSDDHEVGCG
jgi:hypothetical protein